MNIPMPNATMPMQPRNVNTSPNNQNRHQFFHVNTVWKAEDKAEKTPSFWSINSGNANIAVAQRSGTKKTPTPVETKMVTV